MCPQIRKKVAMKARTENPQPTIEQKEARLESASTDTLLHKTDQRESEQSVTDQRESEQRMSCTESVCVPSDQNESCEESVRTEEPQHTIEQKEARLESASTDTLLHTTDQRESEHKLSCTESVKTATPITGPTSTTLHHKGAEIKQIGGVVLVRADGLCCFHLLGAVDQLCANPCALENGQTSCTYPELDVTREQILKNFTFWRDKERARCGNDLAVEETVLNYFGMSSKNYLYHAAGLCQEKKELFGTVVDIGHWCLYHVFRRSCHSH